MKVSNNVELSTSPKKTLDLQADMRQIVRQLRILGALLLQVIVAGAPCLRSNMQELSTHLVGVW